MSTTGASYKTKEHPTQDPYAMLEGSERAGNLPQMSGYLCGQAVALR